MEPPFKFTKYSTSIFEYDLYFKEFNIDFKEASETQNELLSSLARNALSFYFIWPTIPIKQKFVSGNKCGMKTLQCIFIYLFNFFI